MTQAGTYESDEYSDVRVALDGNRGLDITTGWQQATLNLGMLAAGNRTVTFGGYNSKKTLSDEETEILFDNVEMVTVGSGGGGDPRTVRLHKDYLSSIRVATDGDATAKRRAVRLRAL